MKTTDEFNTLTEPQSIDVWDDGMGWDDIKDEDYDIEDEDYNYDDRYSRGCCRCCGCMCWMDEDEEED